MTSLSKKEFNDDIERKVNGIRDMKKVAEQVTLTEFIEQYTSRFDYITLGSMWFSVNQGEITYEEAVKYVAGTD